MTANLESDSRIVAILGSGEALRAVVDPDGILGDAVTSMFSCSVDDASDTWTLDVAFPSGDGLKLRGSSSPQGGMIVAAAAVTVAGRRSVRFPVKPAATVLQAFGSLSSLPGEVKRNLCTPVASSEGAAAVRCRNLFALVRDALFYGIEGGGSESPWLRSFTSVCCWYGGVGGGAASSVTLSCSATVDDGRIVISSDVDVFGLGRKVVTLRYDLGMGHRIAAECFVSIKGHDVASLKVAFDLASRLSGMYSKQRRQKTSLGKPKAV